MRTRKYFMVGLLAAAGVSLGTTQAMDITENKNIEGPQKQKEEPKVETITIVEDASDVITIVDDVMDAAEWVDLEDSEIIEVEEEPEEEETYMVVETPPVFPGGTDSLMSFLRKNVKYPKICRENNIQGRVIVTFVVNKDGSVDEPEVVKKVHPALDQEALRVISLMPNWKPGTQRGKPVKVKYTVPINFRTN